MGKSIIQDTLLSGANGYENAQVLISFLGTRGNPSSTRLPALMIGDFSISAGAAWNTPLIASSLEGVSQSINIGKGVAEAAAKQFGYNLDLGAQIQLKSLAQTTNFWTGSERPVFSVELLYIALNRGFDVRTEVAKLYRSVMPTKGDGIAGADFWLNAPLQYNPVTGAGTFSVSLGKWFRATRQVMKSVQFTYSQEMVPLDGSKSVPATKFAPLYAKGSITFEPYQDITYGQFAGYFPGA